MRQKDKRKFTFPPEYGCPNCGDHDWKQDKVRTTTVATVYACGTCGERPREDERRTEEMDAQTWVRDLGERCRTAEEALRAFQQAHEGELELLEQFELRRLEREYKEAEERIKLASLLAEVVQQTKEGYFSAYLPELKFGVTLRWGDYLK